MQRAVVPLLSKTVIEKKEALFLAFERGDFEITLTFMAQLQSKSIVFYTRPLTAEGQW